MKKCTKCGLLKPLSEFHKRKRSPDGFAYQCKSCTRIRQIPWYERSREKVKERLRKYYKENREKLLEYRHSDKFRDINVRGVEKYRAKNPEKVKAHQILNTAVQKGDIIRPESCELCGREPDEAIHGHHEDYEIPLEVMWVCVDCHADIHISKRLQSSTTQEKEV